MLIDSGSRAACNLCLAVLCAALSSCPVAADDDDSAGPSADDDDTTADDDDTVADDDDVNDDDSADDDDSASGVFLVYNHHASCETKDEFPGWELSVAVAAAHPGGAAAVVSVSVAFDPEPSWVDLSTGPWPLNGPVDSEFLTDKLGYWGGTWVESILFYDENIPPAGCITADGTPYTITAMDTEGTVIEATGTIEP